MSDYDSLIKMVKKGKKQIDSFDLHSIIVKHIATAYKPELNRDFDFVSKYYGLSEESMTLDSIGKSVDPQLTRERVRQIIDSCVKGSLKKEKYLNINAYQKAKEEFTKQLNDKKKFLRFDELIENEFFSGFKKNIKGLISLLNDCDVKQIAYRKKYYFYLNSEPRKSIVNLIQLENKRLRRTQTVKKMSLKAKTVTYVPNEVRTHLLSYAKTHNKNLNPLYEEIIKNYIEEKPFNHVNYMFSRTKSWKARKGTVEWKQVGIYIERDVFEEIKKSVDNIKVNLDKNVSIMSFICQAFIWHYQKFNTEK